MVNHPIGLQELTALLGLALLTAGLAMISISLALIVCGALIFATAVVPLMLSSSKGG